MTKELALIPVCFGSRPGVVHAAVLEDTADAPFLLSLPIMRALDTVLQLSEQRMHFQALQESGKTFFNDRGQLCLRLFDFETLAPECHEPNQAWQPKKIVGDECQVFTLQCDGRVPSIFHDKGDKMDVMKTQLIAGKDNISYSREKQSSQESHDSQSVLHQNDVPSKDVSPVCVHSPQRSSTAETQTCPIATQCDQFGHVDTMEHRGSKRACTEPQTETPEHVTKSWSRMFSRIRMQMHMEQVIKVMISLAIPLMSTLKQVLAVMVRVADPEEMEVIQDMVSNMMQDKKQLEKGRLQMSRKESKDSSTSKTTTSLGSFEVISESSRRSKFPSSQLESICSRSHDSKDMLLWPDPSTTDVSRERPKLHEEVLQLSQTIPAAESMRVLCMDEGHQSRRVREMLPQCFFGENLKNEEDKEEVKSRIKQRIQCLRRRRLGLGTESNKFLAKDSYTDQHVPARVEPSRNQRTCPNQDMSSVRPPGTLQVQGQPEDHMLCGRVPTQEVRSSSSPEPLSLKHGTRKRILGELNKHIQWLENNPGSEHDVKLDKKLLNQILQIRLIGEVLSPERFSKKASQHGLDPGRAYDLELGHQLLDPENRRSCLNHFKHSTYGLVVITPPCTIFSMLQYLGHGKSLETCNNDPQFQQRYQDALTLLEFACIICELQLRRGQSFLFEQPWNARSWRERCLQKLLHDSRCQLVRTDQCMFQQRDALGNLLRKRTGFLTNNKSIAKCLRKECNRSHTHGHCVSSLKGKSVAAGSARYTSSMIHAILRAYSKSCSFAESPSEIYLSAIDWKHSSPDGSCQPLHQTTIMRRIDSISDAIPEPLQEGDYVSDPTQVELQFVLEPSIAQFAANVLSDEAMPLQPCPENEQEDQELQQLSPQQCKKKISLEWGVQIEWGVQNAVWSKWWSCSHAEGMLL